MPDATSPTSTSVTDKPLIASSRARRAAVDACAEDHDGLRTSSHPCSRVRVSRLFVVVKRPLQVLDLHAGSFQTGIEPHGPAKTVQGRAAIAQLQVALPHAGGRGEMIGIQFQRLLAIADRGVELTEAEIGQSAAGSTLPATRRWSRSNAKPGARPRRGGGRRSCESRCSGAAVGCWFPSGTKAIGCRSRRSSARRGRRRPRRRPSVAFEPKSPSSPMASTAARRVRR